MRRRYLRPARRSVRLSGLSVLTFTIFGLAGALAVSALPSAGTRLRPAAPQAVQAAVTHPLDPLTAAEITTAFQVIEAYSQFPHGAFFPTVGLKEPSKSEVLAWSPGQPFQREAFANVFDRKNNRLFEAVVDLRQQKVVSWVERPGSQPAVFATEYLDADRLVRADPRWKKAMHDRGLNPDDVYLDVWAPGDLETPGATPGGRLLRVLSFFRGKLPNPYDRPIEGVVASVDMNRLKVLDVADTGIRPVNTAVSGDAEAPRGGLKRLVVTQPDGPSFKITGREVSWQGWHFRVGFTPREGLVLYQIGYEQNGVLRPIIYRLSLDDIYVPYALPDPNWVWRTAFDVGEYNIAQYANVLEANVDVPENAVFFDEVYASDTGTAGGTFALPHAVAVYERDAGSLWSRTDPSFFTRDARMARELVVTSSAWIGNYIYATEYVFRMDGGIDANVGLTGTTLNRGVGSVAEGDAFGSSVAQNIAAPSHQHYFNFRIDFDVDGVNDRLVEANTRNVPSTFGNAFVTNETVLGAEQSRDLAPASYRSWDVESAAGLNALGKSTAYSLLPLDATVPYSDPGFAPLQRAPFAQHPIWVTRYKDGEMYAAGDYPNQGRPGEGLTKYAASPENVRDTDLVLWYTASMTHHPVTEEYPVMTTTSIGFRLAPSAFFARNPALDAPDQR
jgi:primary-amine oxidase